MFIEGLCVLGHGSNTKPGIANSLLGFISGFYKASRSAYGECFWPPRVFPDLRHSLTQPWAYVWVSNVCGFLDSYEYAGVFQSSYRHSPTFQAFWLTCCLSQLFLLPKVTGKLIRFLSFIVFDKCFWGKGFLHCRGSESNQMKAALQVRSSRETSVRWNYCLRIRFWRHSNLIQPH